MGDEPEFAEGRQEAGESSNQGMQDAVRIFPHCARGEGHFAVLLENTGRQIPSEGDSFKEGRALPSVSMKTESSKEGRMLPSVSAKTENGKRRKSGNKNNEIDPIKMAERWLQHAGIISEEMEWRHRLEIKKSQLVLRPEGWKELSGLRMIQNGLIVGSVAKNRFEPSPQLALAIRDTSGMPMVSFASEDIRVVKYLKGETIEAGEIMHKEELEILDRYILVCVDGFPLGWAKWMKDGKLKNKYYPGWRMV